MKTLLDKLRARRGDPFGVASDPELQLAAVEAAYARYVESPTADNMRAWLNVITATRALGTPVHLHVKMRTTTPLTSDCEDTVYPIGSEVMLVEPLDDEQLVWLVEVRVPDDTLVGGASYDVAQANLVELIPLGRET